MAIRAKEEGGDGTGGFCHILFPPSELDLEQPGFELAVELAPIQVAPQRLLEFCLVKETKITSRRSPTATVPVLDMANAALASLHGSAGIGLGLGCQ